MASKMLTIRNNEGKVCAQKTLTKKLTKKGTKKRVMLDSKQLSRGGKEMTTMQTDTLHTTIDN